MQKTNNMKTEFQNEKCAFTFDLNSKEISGSDLTDLWNAPKCYNKTSRSIKKALLSVNQLFNDNMSMYEVINIINNSGVKMRSYCSND